MNKFLIIFLVLSGVVRATEPLLMTSLEENLHVVANNRVLAKVNGNAITVIDVMKKMDMIFLRQFPEYTGSKTARFQFYTANWKFVLKELIDKELIIADAEEVKMPLSNGDIRQEMETLFGPNVIENLDKVGMSMDDAWKIVKGDMLLRRMLGHRVNRKVAQQITPQDVRIAYEEYLKAKVDGGSWKYRVISIRDADDAKGKAASEELSKIVAATLIEELGEKLKGVESIGESTTVAISEEFNHTEKDISPAYKVVLEPLTAATYSKAIAQTSRTNNTTVYRIFYLASKESGIKPFAEVEAALKGEITHNAIDKETAQYLKKLRDQGHINDAFLKAMIPEDFVPFSIVEGK